MSFVPEEQKLMKKKMKFSGSGELFFTAHLKKGEKI